MWWSNGGPGCSGLMALLTEHGPFRPDGSGGLTSFPYAWNRLVNALYIEAPAGVGFSYSLNASDYTTGDARTANDNVMALLQFYERFPQLQSNPLFLSSESYGGHYLPQLGALLVSPQWASKFPQFTGALLGNPLTDLVEGWIYGMGQTVCGHALASRPTCDAFHSACIAPANFSVVPCAVSFVGVILESGAFVDPLLDTYGLDYPVCPTSGRARRQFGEASQMMRMMLQAPLDEPELAGRSSPLSEEHQLAVDLVRAVRAAFAEYPEGNDILKRRQSARTGTNRKHARRSNSPQQPIPPVYSPCMTDEETVYLNRADVRAALHVSPHAASTWIQCASPIGPQLHYSLWDFIQPQEAHYAPLIAQGNLSLTIFSGDDDAMCATLGTEHWSVDAACVSHQSEPARFTALILFAVCLCSSVLYLLLWSGCTTLSTFHRAVATSRGRNGPTIPRSGAHSMEAASCSLRGSVL